jgi:hypothetical protein
LVGQRNFEKIFNRTKDNLYKEINNIADGQDLQNDLKALESLENEWQMSFNADKCFIITAGTKNTKNIGGNHQQTILHWLLHFQVSHLCRREKVTAQGLFL